MEVGEQIGDHAEAVAGQDEDRSRLARPRPRRRRARAGRLQRAHHGGADGDDRPPLGARAAIGAAVAARDVVALGVQRCVGGSSTSTGRNVPGPDVQRDGGELVARAASAVEQRGR